MSDTGVLLRMRPQDAILRMINDLNDTNFQPSNFNFSAPTQGPGRQVAIRLTARKTVARDDYNPVKGNLNVTYNRLDIGATFADALDGFTVTLPASTQNVLNELTKRTGQDFFLEDIVLEEITRQNGTAYLIKAKAESLRWFGALEVTLLNLIDLGTLFNGASLPALPSTPILNAPAVSLPYLNATAYRDFLPGLTINDTAQVRSLIPLLFNSVVPTPGHLVEEKLNPWGVRATPGAFNLTNVKYLGSVLGAGVGINRINPFLTDALQFQIDPSQTTNFLGGTFSIPYFAGDFSQTSSFTTQPRLTQSGVVSMSDASAYNTILNPLTVGTIITALPGGPNYQLEPGVNWTVDPDNPSPTNLFNSVVQYNGQKRAQDIAPSNSALDRVLVVSIGDHNTGYRGNISFFYASPITLPLTISGGVVGSAYHYQFAPPNGNGPYTFAIVGGALQKDMTLSSAGLLSGTPTTTGTFSFQIQVTDKNGVAVLFNYIYTVSAVVTTLQLSGTLSGGKLGQAYTSFLNITGGLAPYSNARFYSGNLPGNMAVSTLPAAVQLSGNWPAAGSYTFTLAVDSADGQTALLSQTVVVANAMVIQGKAINGNFGQFYNYTFTIQGGVGPYSNARLTAGILPVGLSFTLAGNQLTLSGTVSNANNANVPFTFAVDSSDGQTASSSQSIFLS